MSRFDENCAGRGVSVGSGTPHNQDAPYVQSLKDSLAKMIEWARRPSPIPYIPFRADVDEAERLLKGPSCICPSHASNRGECPIHDDKGRVRQSSVPGSSQDA